MNIAIYCGSALGANPKYEQAAREIGEWIAERGNTLVYGGGNIGLMGIVANTVLSRGGRVIGVIPEFLVEHELAHEHLTEIHVTKTMQERKSEMISLADCYIALPGGPGTLEEISEVVSLARVGQHRNPCIFYNSTGYYDRLEAFFRHMVSEGFLDEPAFEKTLFAKKIEEMDDFIREYTPPSFQVDPKRT